MATIHHQAGPGDGLDTLALALETLELGSGVPRLAGLAARRDRLARSIRSYLIPRLTGEAGPLLVVFAGPTGSGKSTLVNSLSGLELSEAGPLRPTTTAPVVLAASTHSAAFDRISEVDCRVIEGGASILSKIALVDTPDLDSTSVENRAKAEILIDNADIVVFVTSALRYADLIPWEVLRRAASRGAPVINVINRLGAGSAGAVTDFRSRLGREGLDADVVRVPEHPFSGVGHLLPGVVVRELQRRILAAVIELEDDRREVVDRVVRSTTTQILELAGDLDSLIETAQQSSSRVAWVLQEAARTLDLTSLCEGLAPPDPPVRSLPGLIWRWRHRVAADRWARITTTIERRLVSLVEADVRDKALAQRLGMRLSPEAVEGLRTETSSVARTWLGHLVSLAAPVRGGQLGALTLADAAVRGERTPAFNQLFDDGSLVARAQRDLVSRLEEVYQQLGAHPSSRTETLSLDRGDTDLLREVAATVAARSHFADA